VVKKAGRNGPPERAQRMSQFDIYKRGQGKYTRLGTFAGAVGVVLIGAYFLPEKIALLTGSVYVQFGMPTLLLIVLAFILFRYVVNRPKTADFMIATESEMKKVSWSSRKEIVGSTKVVIVTTFILAVILFGVDFLFALIFQWMGILGA
jgi:preprotein translocase subunit SecE